MSAIPNSTTVNSTVAAYTNFPHLRLDLHVTIGVNEDIGRVRDLLLGLDGKDSDFLDDPPPRVIVKALNDYNLEVELQVWIRDEHRHIQERNQLRERIYASRNRAGVDMPFETLNIQFLRDPSVPLGNVVR